MSDIIGRARKQRVFVKVESVKGTMVFPAASNLVLPAGNATMNQKPTFEDSSELHDTLDVLARFENSLPPGEWSLPVYLRPSGTLLSVPQSDVLFQSLQGSKEAAVTLVLDGAIDDAVTTLDYKTLAGGILPTRGIIKIDSEEILFTAITRTTSTTGTLSGLTRGYNGTSAASHLDAAAITYEYVFYRQDTDSPSFSLWIEDDRFVMGMSGCSVNDCSIGVTNEGGVPLTFSGQGMKMVYAGYDDLAAIAAAGQKDIQFENPKRFSLNSYIWNVTKNDNNSGAGYKITAINYSTGVATLDTNLPAGGWAKDDIVRGYLPATTSANEVGSVIESRDTVVYIDGVLAKIKGNDFSLNVPKVYIGDEVGTTEPENYLEDVRSLTATLSLYFKETDAKYFTDGYNNDTDVPVVICFGNEVGKQVAIIFPKVHLEVPDVTFDSPAVNLEMGIKALGTSGEDSCEIVFY